MRRASAPVGGAYCGRTSVTVDRKGYLRSDGAGVNPGAGNGYCIHVRGKDVWLLDDCAAGMPFDHQPFCRVEHACAVRSNDVKMGGRKVMAR